MHSLLKKTTCNNKDAYDDVSGSQSKGQHQVTGNLHAGKQMPKRFIDAIENTNVYICGSITIYVSTYEKGYLAQHLLYSSFNQAPYQEKGLVLCAINI